MISIEHIEYILPKKKLDIGNKYKNINKKFLNEKIGAHFLPRFSKKNSIIQMCNDVSKKINIKKYRNKIKSLILCTQNPDNNGLPHNSSLIHRKLKLSDNVACFDLSQGCAGYLYGIVATQPFLKEGDYGLLFTCDPYSKIINENNFNTDIIFGDAATLTILKKNQKGKNIIDYEFFNFGDDYSAIINNNGLKMDGKKVMQFCTTVVPEKINKFLKERNLNIESIDQFYFHQGSKFIVEKIFQKLGILKNKNFPFISNLGNTVSSTIPILMKKYNFKKKKKILICGFGVGLSVSIGLIQ